MSPIRRARPEEAERISALAVRSKAYWSYNDAQMRVFAEELTLTSEQIEREPAWVAEEDGKLLGFCTLNRLNDLEVELGHLFIAPDTLRRGYGTLLLYQAREHAIEAGYRRMIVESDPNAADFYRRHGGSWLRDVPTRIPGREIPQFAFALAEDPT